jgi:predicted ATP-dependent endonuclease of OLD family
MKLVKFRIQNYKSILDTTCYPDQKLTIFAGQNESGKSNILDALTKINSDRPAFAQDEYINNNNVSEDKPLITYDFIVKNETVSELAILTEYDLLKYNTSGEFEVNVSVSQGERLLNFDIDTTNLIEAKRNKLNKFFIEKTKISRSNLRTFRVKSYAKDAMDFLNSLIEEIPSLQPNTATLRTQLTQLVSTINTLYTPDAAKAKVLSKLKSALPKFILFSSINDELPKWFDLAQVTSNKMIKRLEKYLNADFASIFAQPNSPEGNLLKSNLCQGLSKKISDDFKLKYKQRLVKIILEPSGNTNLAIQIKDFQPTNQQGNTEGSPALFISQRSKGLQWYINFYITLKGECIKGSDVILIDEPGLSLHPKAQLDLLKILEENSSNNATIISTHSPYLIDVNHLERLRLVEKISCTYNNLPFSETKIIEKIHKYTTPDTIKPIQDAIGYSISDGLNPHQQNILICEGISDYYYVKALQKYYDKADNQFLITHSKGCTNMSCIINMYRGLGVKKIYVLLDADNEAYKTYNELLKDQLFEENQILKVADFNESTAGQNKYIKEEDGVAIEDIFKRVYFLKNILGYSDTEVSSANDKNSLEVKLATTGKYLLAKQFYNHLNSQEFNKEEEDIFEDSAKVLIDDIYEKIQ